MKVSALITTFNRRAVVRRAIKSVLLQTIPVDEIIVIDDGSTDGTQKEITQQFASAVRVVYQQNQGVSGARHRAIREARNEWVAFLDSDDEWTSDRNRLLTESAENLPGDVAWLFGDVQLVQDKGEAETLFGKFGLRLDSSPTIFADAMAVQHPFQFGLLQASLIRRAALLEVNAFAEGLRHSEDFLAGVQVACRYRYAAIRDVVTRLYRTSDLKCTSLVRADQWRSDYYHARVAAYKLIADTGRKGPWGELCSDSVRSLCKMRSENGEDIRALSLQQFKFGISGASLAFSFAAMFGRPGMKVWELLGHLCRRLLPWKQNRSFKIE